MANLGENYRRNNTFEEVIKSLNEALYAKKFETFPSIDTPQTSIHIIGAPRSGTTLLSQLILSHLDIGYINHLIASFWLAPIYGIHLSQKLLHRQYTSNFQSDFGRTNNILEPHEFSYFWKKHLNYSDFLQMTYQKDHSINWEELRKEIYQMVAGYQKPIVFKSFLFGFHGIEAVKHMPNCIFLLIKRDIYQNALSILRLRENRFGDKDYWASIKPHQYHDLKNETIYRQIMGQIYFLNYEYEKQLSGIKSQNKLSLSYNELCLEPESVLNKIQSKITNFTNVEFLKDTALAFTPRKSNIAEDVLYEFKKAEDWLLKTYIELTPLKC